MQSIPKLESRQVKSISHVRVQTPYPHEQLNREEKERSSHSQLYLEDNMHIG